MWDFTECNPAILPKLRDMQNDRKRETASQTARKTDRDHPSCRKPRAVSSKPKCWQSDCKIRGRERDRDRDRDREPDRQREKKGERFFSCGLKSL